MLAQCMRGSTKVYPEQGDAFHMLCWSSISIVVRVLSRM
jgi:hypothetical protein